MDSISNQTKILVTGAQGKIGHHLVQKLRQKYGRENVIGSGRQQNLKATVDEPFVRCDITDYQSLEKVIVDHKIGLIFNLAAALSLACENNPTMGINVNMHAFENLMELARIHHCRVFHASSMAVYGPSTPKQNAPDVTVLNPKLLYGCTKVHNELLGEFYYNKFGVDFRCIRIVTVLSVDGGDLTDKSVVGFAPRLLQEASRLAKTGEKKPCILDVSEHCTLPYISMDDCVNGIIQLMETPNDQLTLRTYNQQGFSCTVREMVAEIRKQVPDFEVIYEPNPFKVDMLDSVVDSVDDSKAKHDWRWSPMYDPAALIKQVLDQTN